MKSPKAVRITFLGQPLHRIYPHASRYQVFKYRLFRALRWLLIRTGIAAAAFTALTGAYFYGINTAPSLTAVNTIVAPVEKGIAPVMERIFKAESGGHQYGKDGQVLMHINSNGTVDMGIGQINTIWFSTASKMGLDLTKEEDNRKFAIYLYENFGTEPWQASKGKNVWSK